MWFHRWREWLLTFLLKIYIYKARWCNIMKMLFIFRRSWSNKKLCEMCCWLLNTTIHNCLGFFLNLDKSSYGIIGPLKTSKTGSSLPMHFTFRSMFFLCMYTLFEETYFLTIGFTQKYFVKRKFAHLIFFSWNFKSA